MVLGKLKGKSVLKCAFGVGVGTGSLISDVAGKPAEIKMGN